MCFWRYQAAILCHLIAQVCDNRGTNLAVRLWTQRKVLKNTPKDQDASQCCQSVHMRQRNPPTLPNAVSSPQIHRDWSVWSRKLNICFGSRIIRKNITKCVSTMDGNPLSAAFTASIVFMINKLTGTGTVIARKAVKHRWLSKGFCCGCVPLRYVFSCHPAVSGPRAHSGSPRGSEVLITLSLRKLRY